jgi:hypothetical protein
MRSTVFVAAALAAWGMAASAQAQDNTCQSAVADALSNYGVEWSTLKNVQWDTDTWNSGRNGQTSTSGYQMYAEPASCSDGSLVVEMWPDCRITDMHTQGSCKIKGIPNHWW